MFLYHYTSHENLASILAEGINRGEAPVSDTQVVKAVNLTTDTEPAGHGLDGGGEVITAEQSAMYFREYGWIIPAGTVVADKLEVRLKVRIPSSDKRLKRWNAWAAKHCVPGYAARLAAAAGGSEKAATWWLYFGAVPPSAIVEVVSLKSLAVAA